MSFDSEREAFEGYAEVLPNNCVFLVDTYDTLQGVREAIAVGRRLREAGHEMVGIRLDSGDLAYLSIEARKLLDEAGFPRAQIVASNDLDERIIESLKQQGATIAVWGVGTRLATAYDQPALGGVYKLGALQDDGGVWQPKLKLSEQAVKTTIPGVLQVRRFETAAGFLADMIFDEIQGADPRLTIVDSKDPTRRRKMPADAAATDLLVPVFRGGRPAQAPESLSTIRSRAAEQLARLHPGVRRFLNPHEYPVGIDLGLHELRQQLIESSRPT
jgi:nicotinate phosphoribosyltransferase